MEIVKRSCFFMVLLLPALSPRRDVSGFAVPFSGGDLLECVPEIASALIMHTFVRNSQALLPRSPAHSFFDQGLARSMLA
jgi:hypothetical protein